MQTFERPEAETAILVKEPESEHIHNRLVNVDFDWPVRTPVEKHHKQTEDGRTDQKAKTKLSSFNHPPEAVTGDPLRAWRLSLIAMYQA